jgi:hypothetical protein
MRKSNKVEAGCEDVRNDTEAGELLEWREQASKGLKVDIRDMVSDSGTKKACQSRKCLE